MKLIASKPFSYGTRRLLANDEFEATDRHGRLLIAVKKARESDKREPGKLAAPPSKLKKKVAKTAKKPAAAKPAAKVEPAPEAVPAMTTKTVNPPSAAADNLAALRQQYKDKFGKSPFMGWSASTLQDKLTETPA